MPGHFLHISGTGIKITKYWEPENIRIGRDLLYEKALLHLKSLVLDAVKIRCDNRFTAGAHVSGGIDSGIVSALVRKEYAQQEDFYGFSWSPGDFAPKDVKSDERELAKKSAEKAEIKLLFSGMTIQDFRMFLSDYYCNQGYFSEYGTVHQAAEVNTNLIFSGWGGDEFISTGDRGIEQDLLRELRLRTFFRRNPVLPLKKFVKDQLYFVVFPALGILDRETAKSFRSDARYIKKPFKKSDRKALRNFYFHTSRHQLHLRMLQFYHLQERCESWFVMGYRCGVEYRFPLLDRRIIEYMLKVPSELLCKINYPRPILREIGEDILPGEVLRNKSKNDPVYRDYINDIFKGSAGLFMEEVSTWRANPDLHFMDFDLLTEDIRKYKEHSIPVDERALFRALVYLKAIHEFTVTYRK